MRRDFETLNALAKEHGDSFYIIDVDRFRANLRDLSAAFRAIHPVTGIGYSYKTNYVPVLCRIADEEGCYAEVVSKTEYDIALRLGVRPERIIFNGPLKLRPEIEEALLAGATVNLDSACEISGVEAISRDYPDAVLCVGLRCNFTLNDERPSKFGFAEDELTAGLARLRALPQCEVRGLHCHFSAQRDLASFERRAIRLIEVARRHFIESPPRMLDIGGGFYGHMPPSLRKQFGDVPSYQDYARAVASIVSNAFPGSEAPELVLEPGAAVVANAVSFIARIGALKRVGERQLAVMTGSLQNIKATNNDIRLPIQVVRDPSGEGASLTGETDITGYTCMERDVMYESYFGALRVGDFVVFDHVGAYTSVFKPPFIRPAPAMLAWSQTSARPCLARRAERLDDLLATYVI